MTATILMLGHRLEPLEPIERVRIVLGLKHTKAFRVAAQDWPLIGESGGRLVIVPALAVKLGIPYEIIPEEES